MREWNAPSLCSHRPAEPTAPRGVIRRRSLAPALAFGLVAMLAFAPAPARAAAAPTLVMPSLAAVRAGETLELRWNAHDAPIEELELQLSLDDGRHYRLRISPELDPRSGEFRWRVPNLASGAARVRMRYNLEGREVEGEASAPFRILIHGDEAAELAQVCEGSWWAGIHGLDLPAASEALAPEGETLMASAGSPAIALLPPTTAPATRDASRMPIRRAALEPREILLARPGAPPRFVPARN